MFVSYAYIIIFLCFLLIGMPWICFPFRMTVAVTSAHNRNKLGDNGHPCRTPSDTENAPKTNPLFFTELSMVL